jgi:Protein of unknown function DUF86.
MNSTLSKTWQAGIISSAERVRDLKDLRNDIVHEYETDDLRSLFRNTLDATPELFGIAEEIERYCRRF